MTRYKAFLLHFILSCAISILPAYLIVYHWYPDIFFAIDGGREGMQIIIGLNLILGPLLTLVVYKTGKSGLIFDLILIGIIQASCLTFGLYTVYIERPIFFVYYDKHFYSSSADTYSNYHVDVPDPLIFSEKIPAKVASLLPENPIEEADFRLMLYRNQIPPWVYERTYVKLDGQMDKILEEGASEEELLNRDTEENLKAWLLNNGGTFRDYVFIPIHSRYRNAFLGIRKSDKSFVGIVEIPAPT